MDFEILQGMKVEDLARYMRARLRLEEPLAPPLDFLTRMEPPEDFLIRAYVDSPESFQTRFVDALRQNLVRVTLDIVADDERANEHVASLAFLADSIEANGLVYKLYELATALMQQPPGKWDSALFHLLRTTARLTSDDSLLPFWDRVSQDRRPRIREAGFYGLTKVAPDSTLEKLPEILADRECDFSGLVWYMATEQPGLQVLAKAAQNLGEPEKQRLRELLKNAGGDAEMLLELESGERVNQFHHVVNFPINRVAARRMPRWTEAPLAAQAAYG